jgi:hypothetical protein
LESVSGQVLEQRPAHQIAVDGPFSPWLFIRRIFVARKTLAGSFSCYIGIASIVEICD